MEYRKGSWNVVANALLRYPMLGSERLARLGLDNALQVLLSALPNEAKEITKLWVWASRDTEVTARIVQA
jgi:uncharacterized membrane protein YccC